MPSGRRRAGLCQIQLFRAPDNTRRSTWSRPQSGQHLLPTTRYHAPRYDIGGGGLSKVTHRVLRGHSGTVVVGGQWKGRVRTPRVAVIAARVRQAKGSIFNNVFDRMRQKSPDFEFSATDGGTRCGYDLRFSLKTWSSGVEVRHGA